MAEDNDKQDQHSSPESSGKEKMLSLAESEARYRRLFEAAQDGILIIDFDSEQIIAANPFIEKLLTYAHDELVGKKLREIDPFKDLWRSKIAFDELKTRGHIRYEDLPLQTKDGGRINVEFVSNVYSLDGTRVIQCNIRDITERKRMEEEIRNLARFPSENPNPVLRLDRHGTVLSANEASKPLLQAWGCGIGQVAPKTWRDLAADALSTGQSRNIDVEFGGKSYTFLVKPIMEAHYVNLYGRNITERKRAEEALQQSEQRYRIMFENMSSAAAVYEVVDDGKTFIFKDFNRAAERIEKIKREQLIGKNVLEIFPGLRDFNLFDVFQRVWRTGNPEHHPIMFYKDNRISGWRENYVYRLPSGEVVAVYEDVTERKRMEEELGKLSQFRESIIDNANVWIDVLDENANVVIWNKAAEVMSGYSREEVVGHGKIWEWLYPDEQYRKDLTDLVAEVIQRGRVEEDFETRIRRKDGQIRIISWNERNLLNEHGKPIGSIALGRDVTEHKRMEEELKRYSTGLERLVLERTKKFAESERRLQYVVTSNPAVIYAGKPLADYSDFVLTYLSERVVSMLGFEPREFIGHPEFWERHVPPEEVRSVLAEMPRLWKEGQYSFEYRFLHKDGAYRWIREEAKVVRDADGKPTEVNGYWTDVTERKRLEEALLTSQRMATIGELAAMVGHDLRNPLTGIAGATYYLKKKDRSRLSRQGKEMLKLIEHDVWRSDKIVNDLLEYSKEIHLEPAETNVKSITEGALKLVKIPRGMRVLDSTKKQPKVRLDVDKMKRVFVNIITNALDAMPDEGILRIASRRSDGNLDITFTDTGTGMTRETLENLWRPLFTTKAKGMGFGLAISKRLVEEHGGSISVKSKPGKGSTFTVTLPINANRESRR